MKIDPKEQLARGTLSSLMAVQRNHGNKWPILDEAGVMREASLKMVATDFQDGDAVIATLSGDPKRTFLIEVKVVEITEDTGKKGGA